MGNSLSWAAGNSLLSWRLDAALGGGVAPVLPWAQPGAPSGAINVPASGPDVRAWGQSRSQSKVSPGGATRGRKGSLRTAAASEAAYTSGRRSRHRVITS